MTAPNSSAVINCMRNTLAQSKISSYEIDLISGHLTGTKGDITEIKNWVVGLNLKQKEFPLINTPKSMIGHCIAGAGSIELVTIIQWKNHLYGNYNIKEINPKISVEISPNCIPTNYSQGNKYN